MEVGLLGHPLHSDDPENHSEFTCGCDKQVWKLNQEENKSEVAQLCLTLCDPMDCSLPGSSVHGIFQARVLQWVAVSLIRRRRSKKPHPGLACPGEGGQFLPVFHLGEE